MDCKGGAGSIQKAELHRTSTSGKLCPEVDRLRDFRKRDFRKEGWPQLSLHWFPRRLAQVCAAKNRLPPAISKTSKSGEIDNLAPS